MFDIPISVDPLLLAFLQNLLTSGKASYNGIDVDMTELQTMTIRNNKLVFNPPIKLRVTRGVFRVETTITTIQNLRSGIHVNVDNSPIDIRIQASA